MAARCALKLYQTDASNRLIWDRDVPNPTNLAIFSHDATMLATTGLHDRLVKLWKRQAFGPDDTRFDFIYLPHPKTVTALHWTKSHRHEHHTDNVLFSICVDQKIRVWAVADPHGIHSLQFWAEIDMQESIKPRNSDLSSAHRYVFFIDSTDLALGRQSESVETKTPEQTDDHALEHFREVVKSVPEVCVILDQCGNMSAWGIEKIGHDQRHSTDVFNIAHVEDFRLPFLHGLDPSKNNLCFLAFANDHTPGSIVAVAHFFDGRIVWLQGKLHEFMDPSPREKRFTIESTWAGHEHTISSIELDKSGRSISSTAEAGETLIWQQVPSIHEMSLHRKCTLRSPETIDGSLLLNCGSYFVGLCRSTILLYDTGFLEAEQKASSRFQSEGTPLGLFQVLPITTDSTINVIAAITTAMEFFVWTVSFQETSNATSECADEVKISRFNKGRLDSDGELVCIRPISNAYHSTARLCNSINSSLTNHFFACATNGIVSTWSAMLGQDRPPIRWQKNSSLDTQISNPTFVDVSSTRKTAVVCAPQNSLTIWDQIGGQLEHDASFPVHESVQAVKWSRSESGALILAVIFPHKIVLLAQLNYNLLRLGPTWAPVRTLNTRELASHPIGDVAWLDSGNLLVGAGNQLFLFDKGADVSCEPMRNIQEVARNGPRPNVFDLVAFLNRTLPVYHPQFLTQCITAGKSRLVHQIILGLKQATKFYVEDDSINTMLDISVGTFVGGEVVGEPVQ